MLRELLSFALPLIAGPVATVLVFGIVDLLRGLNNPMVNPEAAIELALVLPAYTALACIASLRISLRAKQTVQAVMLSVGLLILVGAVQSLIVQYALVSNFDLAAALFGPFSPYTSVTTLVDLPGLFTTFPEYAVESVRTRLHAFVGSFLAAALYFLILYRNYTGLVREFDMTLRKQSGA